MRNHFELVIVGGGHAGVEAALISARMGVRSALVTLHTEKIGEMSCNPSIGGLGKGQIVREIDVLGGEMARAADRTAVQIKTLNTRKGPAVQSVRTQNDRVAYRKYIQDCISKEPNLEVVEGEAEEVLIENASVAGLKLVGGSTLFTDALILATGTFLNGLMHTGFKNQPGGRSGEKAATKLSKSLLDLGFEIGRLKTGTPPRLNGRSIDYTVMEEMGGDILTEFFSYESIKNSDHQLPCYLTYTNADTHQIIRSALDRSPLFTGMIEGRGPRYCPSIEDKVVRFPDKASHQIILEPEGWNTTEIYVNGFSTSLPEDIQTKALHSIRGLADAEIIKFGYAVEYDFIPPHHINASLETKLIGNLFLAGQINGTTGYEEAAAQGLIAGINASLNIRGKSPFILDRSEAYIGVMIDDLITKGADEPYRMFTSRAEYRLLLRHDNADLRLADRAHAIGVMSDKRLAQIRQKSETITQEVDRLKRTYIQPSRVNELLRNLKSTPITEPITLFQLLSRPEVSYLDIVQVDQNPPNLPNNITQQVQTVVKYDGYIKKQQAEITRLRSWADRIIPGNFEYNRVRALSNEAREKLTIHKPETIGQASRLAGVNPSDIAILSVYLDKS